MSDNARPSIQLEFSEKYSQEHAQAYFTKHRDGLTRRLSNWREQQIARKALRLAGEPTLLLDLPCGAGRFWPMLAEHPNRVILGADNSAGMLEVACATQPQEVVARVRTLQTSAFDIELPDSAVDSILCMRLLHHIGEAEHRLAMLREFHRVTRDSVIVSLWVDGNYMAWKRKRLEADRARRERRGYQNRFVLSAQSVEAEFREAGFRIGGHVDFMPGYSMWRIYVLHKDQA